MAPLSHSAQPQQRAQSLEVRGMEGGEGIAREAGKDSRKKDGPAEENEGKQGIEQRRKIAQEVCY